MNPVRRFVEIRPLTKQAGANRNKVGRRIPLWSAQPERSRGQEKRCVPFDSCGCVATWNARHIVLRAYETAQIIQSFASQRACEVLRGLAYAHCNSGRNDPPTLLCYAIEPPLKIRLLPISLSSMLKFTSMFRAMSAFCPSFWPGRNCHCLIASIALSVSPAGRPRTKEHRRCHHF